MWQIGLWTQFVWKPWRYCRVRTVEWRVEPTSLSRCRTMGQLSANGKLKQIYRIHSIRALFEEMRRVVTENETAISVPARTKWSAIPDELAGWIDSIEKADPMSDAFRYQVSKALPIPRSRDSSRWDQPNYCDE